MTTPTPAGWYPDPNGDLRFWDGAGWTAQTAAPPSAVAVAPPPVQVEVVPARRSVNQQLRRGLVVGGVLLAVIVGASWIASVTGNDGGVTDQEVHDQYCQSFGDDDPTC